MNYKAKAFIAIILFYGIQIALNHYSGSQRFMIQCWHSNHWYSPANLSSLFFTLAVLCYVLHYRNKEKVAKLG